MVFLSYILYISLILCSTIKAENDNDTPQQIQLPSGDLITILPPPKMEINLPKINVEVNIKNITETNTDATSQSTSTSQATAINETFSYTMLTATNKVKEIKEYAKQIPENLQPWVIHNKWRIVSGCIAGLYIYTWYRIVYLSYALSDPDAWHNYKTTLSFDELLQIPQKELAHNLIRAIQQHYAPQAIEDFFMPFTLFTKDIEKEMIFLKQLIKIYKRIRILRINWLFPWQKPSLEQAQEKLRRILYLRNVTFSWLGSFKLDKITDALS